VGKHSNINKPNERKIHTNMLFHLGFVEIISSPQKTTSRQRSPIPRLVERGLTGPSSRTSPPALGLQLRFSPLLASFSSLPNSLHSPLPKNYFQTFQDM